MPLPVARKRTLLNFIHMPSLLRHTFFGLLLVVPLVGCGGPRPLADIDIPFTGESVMAEIKGEPYRFFRYETAEAAQADRATISVDGKEIGGKKMSWDGPVHIFFLNKRIVIYVGSNADALSTIEQVFGPQIAGE